MLETAETFEHWLKVRINGCEREEDSASIMMRKTAKTFDNYFILCGWEKDIEYKKLAFAKASEMAETFEQWFLILNHRLGGKNTKKIAFAKILEMEITFEQWLEIQLRSTDPEQKQFSVKMMFEKAKTFDNWCRVCVHSCIDSELHKSAFTVLSEMPGVYFEQWLNIYREYDNRELSYLAFTKMSEEAEDFDRWYFLLRRGNFPREIKELALKTITEMSLSKKQWQKLFGLETI